MNPFNKEKQNTYPPIERGTSFVIPVFLLDEQDKPIISPDLELYFTLKKDKFDYDYDDDFALIKKDAVTVDPHTGRYDIKLSSKDTWLPPSEYYFDIMLKKGADTYRLYCASVEISAAPSNRYQTDAVSGGLFGEPINLGAYAPRPINMKLPGQILLDPKDMPLTASPKYLLKDNKELKTKEIQHFTSRMRFPLVLEPKKSGEEFFIFDTMAPFNFGNENPLGSLGFSIDGDNLAIWSIPRRSSIEYFAATPATLKVGEKIKIENAQDFVFHISFEDHLVIVSGKHCGNKWPLMVEWFDFNK